MIWLRKTYVICILSQHLYLPGRVNVMIYHQFLEICYSILFDQESEKTQKLQVSVGKFPFLNKTFGVKFRNIFLQNMLYHNYIDD